MAFDPISIRKDFAILSKGIIYADSACMSLKPKQVVDAITKYYEHHPACSGRSSHELSKKVEHEIRIARDEVRRLINAKDIAEIIFTRNTTEGINLVVNSIGLKQGDHVIISGKEHNSNLVPWLKAIKTHGITLSVVVPKPDGTFDMDAYKNSLSKKTRFVSVVHTSNVDGVTFPIKEIAQLAHKAGAHILVDGAQSAPGQPVDVRELDVDFFAFSGHKLCGPTGVGALYGKRLLLESMDQFLVGGDTVADTTYDSYKELPLPERFEAGLQDYAGIIGFGAACTYIRRIDLLSIRAHEIALNIALTKELQSLIDTKKITVLGPADPKQRGGIFNFIVDGMEFHDVALLLSEKKIMVRSGVHCVNSYFHHVGIEGSVRVSLYVYNTIDEVKMIAAAIKEIVSLA